MKLPKFGYCAVTADFLHIGHIRFIQECVSKCHILNVGVMSDECVKKYKGRYPIMNESDRLELVRSIKGVQWTYLQNSFEFNEKWLLSLMKFHGRNFVIFDSEEHKRKGADIIIPRTKGISSSKFKEENENINTSQL